jgi:four helix bundle protein
MNDTSKQLRERSFAFALRIVKLVHVLESGSHEWVLSRQLLKSGTSIGANIREARFAQSNSDFVSKLSIALKEGEETAYWLELLHAAGSIPKEEFDSLSQEVNWLIGTLVNVVKACKNKTSELRPRSGHLSGEAAT